MTQAETTERRLVARRRVLKQARVLLDKKSVISCVVRNLTDHGSRLEFSSILGVPDDFTLDIVGEEPRKAQIVWKTFTGAGVEFR